MKKKANPGIEEGKLYRKTEDLLRDYNSMVARVKNIELDLARYEFGGETDNETIEGMVLRAPLIDGLPKGGEISDSTARVAENWRKVNNRVWEEIEKEIDTKIEKIEQERNSLKRLLMKIENAIASLSEDEQLIVRGFYIEQKPWYDIAHEVQYVERHCKRLRTRAIWYMTKSIWGSWSVKE